MPDHENCSPGNRRTPWNKGKLIGARPPLRPKHGWAIRTRLLLEGRIRDLALFNLAIDSKLRGCDVVAVKVEDVAPNGYLGRADMLCPAVHGRNEPFATVSRCRSGRLLCHHARTCRGHRQLKCPSENVDGRLIQKS